MSEVSNAIRTSKEDGLKVLVLDDEAIISMDIAMQLSDLGHTVLGPFQDAAAAMDALAAQTPDVAIIDYNLRRGSTSKPVAEYLIEHGIPFSFLSGHSSTGVLEKVGFGHCKVISKPVSPTVLAATVTALAEN